MTCHHISIVIPSLNENCEKLKACIDELCLDKTVQEVIVIDDCSDSPLKIDNARVIRNNKRMGSAASRHIGIAYASSPFILTTDAHVRPRTRNWGEIVCSHLEMKPMDVVCSVCIPVGECSFRRAIYGGRVDVLDTRNGVPVVFETNWNTERAIDGRVGCIMGGCYAFSLAGYRKTQGYSGIKGWCPTEMVSVSLKTRLIGGECVVLPFEMEHEFRRVPPFPVGKMYTVYNKMRLATVIFPSEISTIVPTFLQGKDGVRDDLAQYMSDFSKIMTERDTFAYACGGDMHKALLRSGISFGIDSVASKVKNEQNTANTLR